MRSSSASLKKADFQRASAVGIAQMDFGAQALAQLVLQAGDMGIARSAA